MDPKEQKYRKRILTIPNLLSLFRLLLIPAAVWLYTVAEDPVGTTLVLALSGLTDVADGIIARKFHMVSDLGKALDPIADKLTQTAMLLCMVGRFPNMLLPLLLLVVKELSAGVLSLLVIRKTGQVYGAVWHGKVTTVLLYGTMLIHLLWYGIPETVSDMLIGGCTAMLLLSGALYCIRHIRLLTGKEARCENP